MSREEQSSKPLTSKKNAEPSATAAAVAADDVLLRALHELPIHTSPGGRIHAEARAAFVRAFDDEPLYAKIFGGALRAIVPAVLASVVGLYLFWAFAAAISLNQ